MATLDFTELDRRPPGEALEALVRLIGERLGMVVQWTGRGADSGIDMLFVEQQHGPLGARSLKWLVNCKDHSATGASVGEREVGSISDKLGQHRCDGFLLATTTTASTALKEKLDQLDLAAGGRYHTKVWDRFELTRLLGQEQLGDIRRQFFPRQEARAAAHSIDAARQIVEGSLPRVATGIVRRHLVPFDQRYAQVAGSRVWPLDDDQRRLIDSLRVSAVRRSGTERAMGEIQKLHFDAFVAFSDALIRNFPTQARLILRGVAASSDDGAVIYNTIEMLREWDDFEQREEIELTQRCDPETLGELYRALVDDVLSDSGVYGDRLPHRVAYVGDNVAVEDARVLDIFFEGGDGVGFRAHVDLHVRGQSFDPEQPSGGLRDFGCTVTGYLTNTGVEIDEVVDGWV